MKKLNRAEAAGFLLIHDRFCILTHRRPDGDTLGSAAALCRGLRKMGKQAYILTNPDLNGTQCRWLVEGLTKDETAPEDTLVAVDVASASMLPNAFAPLADRVGLRIDHHGTASPFGQEELVDPQSASCAELICDVLNLLGVELDREIAEAVYVGASTDTGCFRFANTTAHTLLVASLCAQAGAELYQLNQLLFETNTLSKLRMQAWIAENLQFFDGGKMALVAIPRAVEDLIGVTEDDMDNISSFPRTVAGVCMAATLRQTKDGQTKLSMRAVPGMDCGVVCARFGGGGHKGAAGATLNSSLEEAARAVKTAMLELA